MRMYNDEVEGTPRRGDRVFFTRVSQDDEGCSYLESPSLQPPGGASGSRPMRVVLPPPGGRGTPIAGGRGRPAAPTAPMGRHRSASKGTSAGGPGTPGGGPYRPTGSNPSSLREQDLPVAGQASPEQALRQREPVVARSEEEETLRMRARIINAAATISDLRSSGVIQRSQGIACQAVLREAFRALGGPRKNEHPAWDATELFTVKITLTQVDSEDEEDEGTQKKRKHKGEDECEPSPRRRRTSSSREGDDAL